MKVLTDNWKRFLTAAVALFAAMGMVACSKEEPAKKEPETDSTITIEDGLTIEDDLTDTELEEWAGWPDFSDDPIVLPDDMWE